MRNAVIRFAAFLLLVGCACGFVRAQAWIPPKGWTSITFTTGTSSIGDHIFSTPIIDGVDYGTRKLALGDIDSRTAAVGFVYGVTDRVAVSADMSYVSSRYIGPLPESEIDDGRWHGDFADFRALVRYQAYRGRVVVTPFAGAVVPSNDYEHHGHASVGRGLWEIPLGASLGVPFGRGRTHSYLSATYAYSVVENLEGFGLDRSNALLEAGFFPTRGLTLRVQAGWQETHDGLDWTDVTAQTFHVHDAGADADYYSAGGGVAYSINESVDLYLNHFRVLNGSNTHELRSWTFGLAWNVAPRSLGRRTIGDSRAAGKAGDPEGVARLARLSETAPSPR